MKSKARFLVKRIIDDSIGFILFKILSYRKKKSFPKKINKIIIYKLSAIGDSILSLPTIKILKEKTNTEIIVIHSNDNKNVFYKQPFIDKTILLNVSGKNPFKILKSLKRIKKESADIAIDLSHTGNLSGVFSYFTSKYTIGFFNPNLPKRKNFYDSEIKMSLNGHMVHNYLKFLEIFKIKPNKKIKLIPLVLDKKYNNKLFGKKKNLIGIHPCHEVQGKSWDSKKFARIIDYLIKKKKTPVIFGSPKEKEKVDELLKLVKNKDKVINLAGKTSIMETYALMKDLDFFIANDGGIMHMAASLNLPTLGIFNVDIPTRYAPFNEKSLGIKKETSVKKVIKILDERFI